MSESNKEHELAKRLLHTFAIYGYQKTSMQDLANSAGLSRQSIYKKFGSKDKCYQWVIRTYLENMYSDIFQILDNDDQAPKEGLLKTFDVFIGNALEVTSNSHGPEVLDDTLKATHSSAEDWPLRFRTRLADYLIRHKLATNEDAVGIAYTLITAGKGILVEESSKEVFKKNMILIIDSVTKAQL